MSFADIFIIVFIVLGGFIGFRRGVIKEFVCAIGFFLITVLSFFLKNPLSIVFYENLPFFKFGGIFKGVTVLNIALYELIAFLIVFLILMLLWKLVVFASSIIQKIINLTIILGPPSKILGFLIGIIEFYIISFIVIYILTLPIFSVSVICESHNAQFILNDTLFISNSVKSNVGFLDEFLDLKEKYEKTDSANKFNYETLDLFMKYDIVDVKSVKKLKEKNKISIDGINDLIEKYEEE